ncbi:MAG: DUF481 domain-containing protein [Planctomycetota bacterium]
MRADGLGSWWLALVSGLALGTLVSPTVAQDGAADEDAEGAEAEEPPPSGFFDGWDGRFLVGVFGTTGNSESNTIEFITDGERDTDESRSSYELLYNFSRSDGEIGANNARLTLANDYKIPDSDWFAYVEGISEYDELKAWDGRFLIEAGVGYQWIDEEDERLVSRVGGAGELEVGSADTSWNPLLTFETEYETAIDERQDFSAFVGALFDLSDGENVRVTAGAEYSWLIDPDRNMSLVGRVETEFDAQPGVQNGVEDNEFDTSYSILLSWEY